MEAQARGAAAGPERRCSGAAAWQGQHTWLLLIVYLLACSALAAALTPAACLPGSPAVQAAGKPDVASNAYRDNNKPFRTPRLAYLQVCRWGDRWPVLLRMPHSRQPSAAASTAVASCLATLTPCTVSLGCSGAGPRVLRLAVLPAAEPGPEVSSRWGQVSIYGCSRQWGPSGHARRRERASLLSWVARHAARDLPHQPNTGWLAGWLAS